MSSKKKPLFLFADSQLLFAKKNGILFLARLTEDFQKSHISAAYIGASNGDQTCYYEIFQAAMENIGMVETCFVHSQMTPKQREFLQNADIILLAGGDVQLGWEVMLGNGMKQILLDRYEHGSILIGISAGAVQLGSYGYSFSSEDCTDEICFAENSYTEDRFTEDSSEEKNARLFATLHLVPYLIFCHEEDHQWQSARSLLRKIPMPYTAIGIPKGGGFIYYQDGRIEPVNRDLIEFRKNADELSEKIIGVAAQF